MEVWQDPVTHVVCSLVRHKIVTLRGIGQRTFEFESSIQLMKNQGEQRKRRNFEAFKLKQKRGDETEKISKKDRENAVVRTAYHSRT